MVHLPDAAPPRCQVRVSIDPPDPVAPATLDAIGVATGAPGPVSMTWSVTGPGGPVVFTRLGELRVSFEATVAGPYVAGGSATSFGVFCEVIPTTVNVIAAGAGADEVQLRYVPRPGTAPPQLDPQTVLLRGGADATLPAARVLDRGSAVSGAVSGPGGAAPSYLRLAGAAGAIELFTDGAGRFQGSVTARPHDVLVIPYDDALPPARFPDVLPAALGAGLVLDAGDALSGIVRAANGDPVAGARVALWTGALPPVVATTGGDGRFAARVRAAAGALSLLVVPPAPHGRLEAGGVSVAPGSELDIWLAERSLVQRALAVRAANGDPLPGARVTLVGAPAPGGSVRAGTDVPVAASSHLRVVATAGETGIALDLPVETLTAIVAPPAGAPDAVGIVTLPPDATVVATAAPASAEVVVRDASSAPVASARVVAVARGVRGVAGGTAASARSDAAGVARLGGLIPGMPYDLTVDPPADQHLARARGALVGGGAAPTVTLPAAVRLGGLLIFASGAPAGGVRVEATCASCADPSAVLAETTTDAAGAFVLRLPDPGAD
jgi:hypothetical protein